MDGPRDATTDVAVVSRMVRAMGVRMEILLSFTLPGRKMRRVVVVCGEGQEIVRVGKLHLQPIPYFPGRHDVTRRCWIVLELASQFGDVRINGSADDNVGVAPDLPHQLQA